MMTEESPKFATILESKKKAIFSSERDTKGRFLPGNTISRNTNRVTGISTGDIRRHRVLIGNHIEELLEMLLKEALENKNIQVAMWLVSRILPEAKKVTWADTSLVNNISSLTELKNQAAQTIKEGAEGTLSLEEVGMFMSAYKEHKHLIEAADIEPLVLEVKRRMGGV